MAISEKRGGTNETSALFINAPSQSFECTPAVKSTAEIGLDCFSFLTCSFKLSLHQFSRGSQQGPCVTCLCYLDGNFGPKILIVSNQWLNRFGAKPILLLGVAGRKNMLVNSRGECCWLWCPLMNNLRNSLRPVSLSLVLHAGVCTLWPKWKCRSSVLCYLFILWLVPEKR